MLRLNWFSSQPINQSSLHWIKVAKSIIVWFFFIQVDVKVLVSTYGVVKVDAVLLLSSLLLESDDVLPPLSSLLLEPEWPGSCSLKFPCSGAEWKIKLSPMSHVSILLNLRPTGFPLGTFLASTATLFNRTIWNINSAGTIFGV